MPDINSLLITILNGLRQDIARVGADIARVDEKLTEALEKQDARVDALEKRVDKVYTLGSASLVGLTFLSGLVIDYIKSLFGAKG